MKNLLHLTNNTTNHHMEEQCVTYYLDLNVVQWFSLVFFRCYVHCADEFSHLRALF